MTHECARCAAKRELSRPPKKGRANRCYSCAPMTHGHTVGSTRSRTYRAWDNMVQRATNRRRWDWEHYGGRGIAVEIAWLGRGGFGRFLADMGCVPEGLELDRINNDGHYMKANCRWVSRSQQVANRRKLAKWRRAA